MTTQRACEPYGSSKLVVGLVKIRQALLNMSDPSEEWALSKCTHSGLNLQATLRQQEIEPRHNANLAPFALESASAILGC